MSDKVVISFGTFCQQFWNIFQREGCEYNPPSERYFKIVDKMFQSWLWLYLINFKCEIRGFPKLIKYIAKFTEKKVKKKSKKRIVSWNNRSLWSQHLPIWYTCWEGNKRKKHTQKQSSRGVLRKRCSENMQQIYRRIPMPKYDSNKVALQLYWNHALAWVFFCIFAACFQNTFS